MLKLIHGAVNPGCHTPSKHSEDASTTTSWGPEYHQIESTTHAKSHTQKSQSWMIPPRQSQGCLNHHIMGQTMDSNTVHHARQAQVSAAAAPLGILPSGPRSSILDYSLVLFGAICAHMLQPLSFTHAGSNKEHYPARQSDLAL